MVEIRAVNKKYDRERLGKLSVPDLSSEQLSLFTLDSLRATSTGNFSVAEAQRASGKAWVVDIGGTALKGYLAEINHGVVTLSDTEKVVAECEDGGSKTYVEALRKIAEKAKAMGLPVGISTAGIVSGTDLLDSPNVPNFTKELREAGGFKAILGDRIVVLNDARAGLLAGAIEAAEVNPLRKKVIYLINGGGIGGAALDADGTMISMEPGHIRAARELNHLKITSLCDFMEQKFAPMKKRFACIEKIGAIGAGIVEQWQWLKGKKLDGIEIAEKMYGGDKTALELFSDLTVISAHAAAGMIQALGFSPEDTTIVLHGGGFKASGVVERMRAILAKHYNSQDVSLLPLSENGCLRGVAIAATKI